MRDLTRIDRIAGKLRMYWLRHPDLRLGQIVCNLTLSSDPLAADSFYVEDAVLEAALDKELDQESVVLPYAVLSRGPNSWGLVAYCATEKEAQDMSNSWNRGGSRSWWGRTAEAMVLLSGTAEAALDKENGS